MASRIATRCRSALLPCGALPAWHGRLRASAPSRVLLPSPRASSCSASLQRWAALWRAQGDAFTLDTVNPNLVEWLPELLPGLPLAAGSAAAPRGGGALLSSPWARGTRAAAAAPPAPPPARARVVLVPLCGRTPDLAWLADLGTSGAGGEAAPLLHIVGVDAIAEPLRLFGSEVGNGLIPLAEVDAAAADAGARPALASYGTARYRNLTLLHADMLDPRVTAATLGAPVDAVWDRGGLTAIAPPARAAYAAQLHALMAPGARLLLELLACNLPLEGACSLGDARSVLAGAGFRGLRLLATRDVRAEYPSFAPPGLTQLDEVVLLAERAI